MIYQHVTMGRDEEKREGAGGSCTGCVPTAAAGPKDTSEVRRVARLLARRPNRSGRVHDPGIAEEKPTELRKLGSGGRRESNLMTVSRGDLLPWLTRVARVWHDVARRLQGAPR
jgi:hypothetical protein